MTKSLLNLILSVCSLLTFSNLGFAGSCKTETSDKAETPTTEIAEAEASVDDLLMGCCAAAFAELAKPADDAAKACVESEVVTEVAKADSSTHKKSTVQEMKTGDCPAADTATCDQKESCCGTVESHDSKASDKQES